MVNGWASHLWNSRGQGQVLAGEDEVAGTSQCSGLSTPPLPADRE